MSFGSFLKSGYHQYMRGSFGAVDSLLGTNFVGDYDAKKNFELQNAQFQYSKDLQQQVFNREDTAVQRRTQDLIAAGMNPLLAVGSAANSGAVVSTTAPQRQTAKYDILGARAANASIAKTEAETLVAGETAKNLQEQNANLQVQNELLKAQTIKTIADATGWTTEDVAFKIFGFGVEKHTKVPANSFPRNAKERFPVPESNLDLLEKHAGRSLRY